MSEPAKVFEDRVTRGQWRVEWFDDDGRCESEIFDGPSARRDALRVSVLARGGNSAVSARWAECPIRWSPARA